LAEAVCAGLPTLVAVKESLLPEWKSFVGDGPILPAEPSAIASWVCERVGSNFR